MKSSYKVKNTPMFCAKSSAHEGHEAAVLFCEQNPAFPRSMNQCDV